MSTIKIRLIQPDDNEFVAKLVREVLVEMGVPKVGTAYEDESLDMMFETYNEKRKAFYVVEEQGKIVGGAGIGPLEGSSENICELQKMYFLPVIRGKGIGFQMITTCLDFAKQQGYTKCYLETMPYMEAARNLYKKVGFETMDKPLGDTGHYSCQTWMIKDL